MVSIQHNVGGEGGVTWSNKKEMGNSHMVDYVYEYTYSPLPPSRIPFLLSTQLFQKHKLIDDSFIPSW